MVDFRKIISPNSRAEMDEREDAMMRYEALDRPAMAAALLETSRTIIDSGLLDDDPRYSYDEWGVHRVIPALARRLDPDIELRADEVAQDSEREDALTYMGQVTDEKLRSSIGSVMAHATLYRASHRQAPADASRAVDLLLGVDRHLSMLSVATDTVFPGAFRKRTEADTRAPLPGRYLVAESEGYHRVLLYSEDWAELEAGFEAAIAHRSGGELDLDCERLVRRIDGPMGVAKCNALSIQEFCGEVVRRHAFDAHEPEAEPAL